MVYVKKTFRSLLVLTIWFGLCSANAVPLQAQTLEQYDNLTDNTSTLNNSNPTINKGQIGEQLATCAAYALIMENVSITDLNIRDIWRDRQLALSQQLKDHMISHSNQAVLEKDIQLILTSNAQWLTNHIFFPNQDGQGVVNPSREHSVKQYVMSFCPALYDRIDLQIAEEKGVVVPETSLSIMENKKWDNGMIADRDNNADIPENDLETATVPAKQPETDNKKTVKAVIIQIASYMKREHAERGMIHFEEALSDITPPVILQIEAPVSSNGSEYFRISTIPMLPEEAETACNNMKKKQIGCILRRLE